MAANTASSYNKRYSVKLNIFEGPLDLLLHLIKKNKVDIYDIPMAVITKQYLEYIRLMKVLNLDLAGEYLLMAATLTHIKSRMLLPVQGENDEAEEEAEDPRDELVRKLMDYQRYKEASIYFADLKMLEKDVFLRGYSETDDIKDEIKDSLNIEVSLFELIQALQVVLKESKDKIIHEVTAEKITLKDKITELTERLEKEEMFLFTSLFKDTYQRHDIIVTFLALLELIKLKMVKIIQTELFAPIRILSLIGDSSFIKDKVDE